MNLLTLGRSLSETRERPRYKLMSGALPTFGNPTASSGNFAETKKPSPVREGEAEAEIAASKSMKTESVADVAVKEGSMHAFPAGRWTLKANPFKSSSKPAAQPVVQGELSLDKVRPVRNDLSDCDLELVAKKPEPSAVEVGGEKVSVVKAQPLLGRMLALFQRRN